MYNTIGISRCLLLWSLLSVLYKTRTLLGSCCWNLQSRLYIVSVTVESSKEGLTLASQTALQLRLQHLLTSPHMPIPTRQATRSTFDPLLFAFWLASFLDVHTYTQDLVFLSSLIRRAQRVSFHNAGLCATKPESPGLDMTRRS